MSESMYKGMIMGFIIGVTIVLFVINTHIVGLEKEHSEMMDHILTIESEVNDEL